MSNSEGKVLPYSDHAYQRGVHTASPDTSNVNVPPSQSKSAGIWIGGNVDMNTVREIEGRPTPAAIVEPNTQGRVEGTDFDSFRPGILQSVRDGKTQDILGGRAPTGDDWITIQTNTGREMTVRVHQAVTEGFLFQDANGNYHEADRAAQQKTFEQMKAVDAAKRESEAVKFDNEAEQAIAEMSGAMEEAGLDFTNELAEFIGSDGLRVSQPAEQWAGDAGLDMQNEMRHYMDHLRASVTEEVLAPQGIDPDAFLEWIENNGLVRARATKAALRAHVFKSLDAFHALADEYRSTGMRYKQRRG